MAHVSVQHGEAVDVDFVKSAYYVPNTMEVDVPNHGLNQIRCVRSHPVDPGRLIVHFLLEPDLAEGATVILLLPNEFWDANDALIARRDEVECTVLTVNRERRWAIVETTYQLDFPLFYGLVGANADRIDFYNLSTQLNHSRFLSPTVSLAGVIDENRLRITFGSEDITGGFTDIVNAGGASVRVSHTGSGFRAKHTNVSVDGEILSVPKMELAEYSYIDMVLRVPGYVGNHQLGMYSTMLPREEFVLAKIVLTEARALLYNTYTAQDMVFLPTLAQVSELEVYLVWPDGTDVDMRSEEFTMVLEIDELADVLSSESVIGEPSKD